MRWIWVICTATLIITCPESVFCSNPKFILNAPINTLVSIAGNQTLSDHSNDPSGPLIPKDISLGRNPTCILEANEFCYSEATEKLSTANPFSSVIDLPTRRADKWNGICHNQASISLDHPYTADEQGGEFYPPSASRHIDNLARVAFLTPFEEEEEMEAPMYSVPLNSGEDKWSPKNRWEEFNVYLKTATRQAIRDYQSDNPWLKITDSYDWMDGDPGQKSDSSPAVHQGRPTVPECRLESFDLENKVFIGKGGQATAYLVHLKSNASVRFIFKTYSRPVEFEREIRTVFFPHPSIIKIKCAVRERLSVMMPYAEGGDLWKGFPRTSSEISDDLVVHFAAQLVTAIERMHVAGYLHHDVKPHNLVRFLKKNCVALIDFGLSVPISGAGYRRGTKITMAPEVATVAGYEDAPLHEGLDWWSVGVTIYMLHMAIRLGPMPQVNDETERGDGTLPAETLLDTNDGIPSKRGAAAGRKFPVSNYLPYKLVLPLSRKRASRFSGQLLWNAIPESFSPELCSLLKRLLHPNPERRRFHTPLQMGRLKTHPYFAKVNWYHLY